MAELAPGGAVTELLARLGAAPGRALALSADELQQWPPDTIAALKAHDVLRPGKPGETAVCPGCERACVMRVQQGMRPGRPAAVFIVCDRRDDIGRVPLALAYLERWRVDGQTLGDALAALIGSGACHPVPAVPFAFRLGVMAGLADKAPVQLRFDEHGRALLEVAGHVLELADVLAINGGRLLLDTRHLGRCVDAPAGGNVLAVETAAERTTRLQARKAVLKQQGVKAFLKVLAEQEGISVSMVKRILGRANPAENVALPGWAATAAPSRGVSPSGKPKR